MPAVPLDSGAMVHYYVDGAAETPVLLLHGMGSSYQTGWADRGWPDALITAGFRVLGIDSRGTGSSTPLDEPASFRNGSFLSDITAVLDACGVEAAHLVGYSMGAGHALRYGLTNPSRVRSLTLGGLGGIALAMAGIFHWTGANSRTALQAGQIGLEELFAQRSPAMARYAAAYFEALQQDALEPGELESLHRPVLLAVGDGDTRQGDFAAFTVSQAISERIPGSRRIVFAGRDHGSLAADAEFRDTVIGFLRDHND